MGRRSRGNKTPWRVFLEPWLAVLKGPHGLRTQFLALVTHQVNTGLLVQGFLRSLYCLPRPKAKHPQQCPHLRVGGGPGKGLAGLVSHEEKPWNSLLEGVGSEPARSSRPKTVRECPQALDNSRAKLIRQAHQSPSPGSVRDKS